MTFRRSGHNGRHRLVLEHLESRSLLAANPLEPSFQIRLQPVDLAGNVIDQVEVGQEFDLQMLARDLRATPDAKGLFAAFADIVYRDRLVAPTDSPVQFGAQYSNMQRAELSHAGLINEIGAVAGLQPTGPSEVLVASVRFRAEASGLARFGLDSPDDLIQHAILAYGLSDSSTADTAFRGTSIQVVGLQGEIVADDHWTPPQDLTRTNENPRTRSLGSINGDRREVVEPTGPDRNEVIADIIPFEPPQAVEPAIWIGGHGLGGEHIHPVLMIGIAYSTNLPSPEFISVVALPGIPEPAAIWSRAATRAEVNIVAVDRSPVDRMSSFIFISVVREADHEDGATASRPELTSPNELAAGLVGIAEWPSS